MPQITSDNWNPPDYILKPLLFKAYLAKNLPMALLAGLHPVSISYEKAVVSLPYRYLTKNPFQSIYFACQCMASELSSGVLAMSHVLNSKQNISMLVVQMEAEFSQKARGTVLFTCHDGVALAKGINLAIQMSEPQKVTVVSTGRDEGGSTVARFKYTWSFKNT